MEDRSWTFSINIMVIDGVSPLPPPQICYIVVLPQPSLLSSSGPRRCPVCWPRPWPLVFNPSHLGDPFAYPLRSLTPDSPSSWGSPGKSIKQKTVVALHTNKSEGHLQNNDDTPLLPSYLKPLQYTNDWGLKEQVTKCWIMSDSCIAPRKKTNMHEYACISALHVHSYIHSCCKLTCVLKPYVL